MAVSTSTTATAWSPDVTANYPGDVIPEALVMRLTTQAGTVEGDAPVVRVPVVNDDTAAVVPEGQPIPEGAPELAEAVVQTAKVAKLLRISREQWEQDGTDQRLSETAGRSLITKADDVLLNADGTGDAPAGLLHQSIPAAGAVDTDLDVLIDAISTAQTAGATPSHILVAPDAWASLRKFKNTDTSNESLLGAGTRDATAMLLGLPVVTNKAVPAGTGLILDRNDVVSAVGDVQSATSRDAYFGADQIGLRATFRFGATVVHADRHATFTVTAPGTTTA